jgi:hypothetical protein
MPRIYYTATNYQGNYMHLNSIEEQSVLCRKIDLYRAMITVGSPSFFSLNDIRTNGFFRTIVNSVIQKILLVKINIESNQNGMYLHPIFDTHVSDQKRIVSYNLGMAFAKIYAEKLLNIPNLIHVETLKKSGAVIFNNQVENRREPDLVGVTSDGNWHVFEAKGMSTNQLRPKLIEAKQQAQKIDTIHGQAPETSSACATYFSNIKILSAIEDPKGESEKKIEIDFSKFVDSYYNPFLAFKRVEPSEIKMEKIENLNFQTIEIKIDSLHLSIGIEEELNELLEQKNYSQIREYYIKLKDRLGQYYDNNKSNFSFGMDGIIVKYSNY